MIDNRWWPGRRISFLLTHLFSQIAFPPLSSSHCSFLAGRPYAAPEMRDGRNSTPCHANAGYNQAESKSAPGMPHFECARTRCPRRATLLCTTMPGIMARVISSGPWTVTHRG
ncbi:hypothetical protein AcV5_003397 [Taiwanofungus camphoratus]|nr:hypothetical protein AcV5_003397 [Antrodia cinnamomea]